MQVLRKRQSDREFSPRNLPPRVLSNLLWAAFGINRADQGKRTAPSASNRQEVDVYVATAEGLYLYNAKSNVLEPVLTDDLRAAGGRQEFARHAPVNLIFVAGFSRMGQGPVEDKILYSAAGAGFISQKRLPLLRLRAAGDRRSWFDRPASPCRDEVATGAANHPGPVRGLSKK